MTRPERPEGPPPADAQVDAQVEPAAFSQVTGGLPPGEDHFRRGNARLNRMLREAIERDRTEGPWLLADDEDGS